jgi:hypothetical protein
MPGINVLNKLIKKSRRWEKKTQLPLFRKTSRYLLDKKKRAIFTELEALSVSPATTSVVQPSDKIIWICWFQGIEQAPLLVQRCIASVQRNAGDARVIVLTEETIADYIALPAHILQKYQQGKISKAHYSDIVRCSLLAQYGGVWMDATVYLTCPLPASLFAYDFSSLRFDGQSAEEAIGHGYWTAYLLASQPGSALVTTVRDLFFRYWQTHDTLIEYFLIDYAFLFCIDNEPAFRAVVEAQPVIGNQRFLIRQFMNQRVSANTRETLGQDPVGIYKLSHKERYQEADGGVPTLYSEIIADTFRLSATSEK